jgi:hypothetical protein
MLRTQALRELEKLKTLVEKLTVEEVDDPEEILQDINLDATAFVEALEFAIANVSDV